MQSYDKTGLSDMALNKSRTYFPNRVITTAFPCVILRHFLTVYFTPMVYQAPDLVSIRVRRQHMEFVNLNKSHGETRLTARNIGHSGQKPRMVLK